LSHDTALKTASLGRPGSLLDASRPGGDAATLWLWLCCGCGLAVAVRSDLDLRGPSEAAEPAGKTRRAPHRDVLSLRQVSLHKQRKVVRAVTARKPLILLPLPLLLQPSWKRAETVAALAPRCPRAPHSAPAPRSAQRHPGACEPNRSQAARLHLGT
jgi:hypothetical protein